MTKRIPEEQTASARKAKRGAMYGGATRYVMFSAEEDEAIRMAAHNAGCPPSRWMLITCANQARAELRKHAQQVARSLERLEAVGKEADK